MQRYARPATARHAAADELDVIAGNRHARPVGVFEDNPLEADVRDFLGRDNRLAERRHEHLVLRLQSSLRRTEVKHLARAVEIPLARRVQLVKQVEHVEAALLASPRAAHHAVGDGGGETDHVVRAVLRAVGRGLHGVVVPVVRPVPVHPHALREVPALRARVGVDERAGLVHAAAAGRHLDLGAVVHALRERGVVRVRPARERAETVVQEEHRGRGRATERECHRRDRAGEDLRDVRAQHLAARLLGETREHGRVRHGLKRARRHARAAHHARRPRLRRLPDDGQLRRHAAVAVVQREALRLHVVARREHDLHGLRRGYLRRLARRAHAVARRRERGERLRERAVAARRRRRIHVKRRADGGQRRPACEPCQHSSFFAHAHSLA